MRSVSDMVTVSSVLSTGSPVQLAFSTLNVKFRVLDRVFPSPLHYLETAHRNIKVCSQLFTCLFSCLLFSHKVKTQRTDPPVWRQQWENPVSKGRSYFLTLLFYSGLTRLPNCSAHTCGMCTASPAT